MRTDHYRGAMSEINVTPFVDVMLVLLIIFMVAAPLLQQGFDVSLPKAATGQRMSHPSSGLVITLTKDHIIYFDEQVVTIKELTNYLKHAQAGTPVMIRADRFAYVDKLIQIWDLCRETGLSKVHIATLPD